MNIFKKTSFILVLCYILICSLSFGQENHGHIKVSGRKFVFEDGTPFIPRGLSIMSDAVYIDGEGIFISAWNMTPIEWLDSLKNAKINFIRAHTYTTYNGSQFGWGSWPVPESIQSHADQVEKNLSWFLTECEKRGIYVAVGLTHFDEFKDFQYHPYHVSQGGPCSTLRDVVTSPAALDLFKQRINFYKRFCKYRSFAMWEVTNELTYSYTAPLGKDQAVADWVIALAQHCKDVDSLDHPVGTSLYSFTDPVWESFFQTVQGHPAIDWISVHTYGGNFGSQALDNFVVSSGKPILGTETYNLGDIGINAARQKTWQGLALYSAELEWSDGYACWDPNWGGDLKNNFSPMLDILRTTANVIAQTLEKDTWGNPIPISIAGSSGASTDSTHLMAFFTNIGDQTSISATMLKSGKYEWGWFSPVSRTWVTYSSGTLDASSSILSPLGELFLYVHPAPDVTAIQNPSTENLLQAEINIWPNPADAFITFGVNKFGETISHIAIYNVYGERQPIENFQISTSSNSNSYSNQINVSKLSSGIYFLRVESNNFSSVKKFVVQR